MLLVITCILAGLWVTYPFLKTRMSKLDDGQAFIDKTKIYIGLIAFFVGLWYFVSPSSSPFGGYWGRVDFIGDLLPALFGILSGLLLSSEKLLPYINFSQDSETSNSKKESIQKFLESQDIVIGLGTLIFGLLHIVDLVTGGYPFI